MPLFPETTKLIKQVIRKNIPYCQPNSSIAITVQAIGVLVHPANTETKPAAASRASGRGTNGANALPKVAPIKNKGVTSPPLKPALKVNTVNPILIRKSVGGSGC